jgi:hypothetical protein
MVEPRDRNAVGQMMIWPAAGGEDGIANLKKVGKSTGED